MEKLRYEEMVANLDVLMQNGVLQDKEVYLFGHCNATEELADLLLHRGIAVNAILDNNVQKHGNEYQGILIESPDCIMGKSSAETVVCIVARAYEAMVKQLRSMGYAGAVYKLIDYNTYAEYSLTEETMGRKLQRMKRGETLFRELKRKYSGYFRIFCPFAALGDIYIMMSYLPHFLHKRGVEKCVVCVVGRACAQVVKLFGEYDVEIFAQKDMDETIQAVLYTEDDNSFIAHQDRPYVVDLHKALYSKCISLEKIYCCGVFGLDVDTVAYEPKCLQQYTGIEEIAQGRAVIFSPYAKSVTALPEKVWNELAQKYLAAGYQCFTNVVGDEVAIEGTKPISPLISEMQSVVERAGTFIGIRSGMCDVIKAAKCRKIALFPDYNYSDTKWKAIDMYRLDGWENIVVKDELEWEIN